MRVKTGITRHKRHKAVLSRTSGYRMTKNRLYKVAKEADLHAGQYAFVGRKLRKRDFRSLWITRISAAIKIADDKMNYSRFIKGLKTLNISLDRKVLADIAVKDTKTFQELVKKVAK